MDCAVEESDIRRALGKVACITSVNFQLGTRTLSINAPEAVVPLALAAIKKAGYEPTPDTADDHAGATMQSMGTERAPGGWAPPWLSRSLPREPIS